MLFVQEQFNIEEVNAISEYFNEYDKEIEVVEKEELDTTVSRYMTSLVSSKYAKSVEDIANTKLGNKRMRRRSLQQVMQESFFSGANRFGNNFIA